MQIDWIVTRFSHTAGGLSFGFNREDTTQSSDRETCRWSVHVKPRPSCTIVAGGTVFLDGVDRRETVCAVTSVVSLVYINWKSSLNISHDDCWLLYLIEDRCQHCTEDAVAK